MADHDVEAVALIDEIERLEAGAWPAGMEAYRAALLALAVRCEVRPGAVAEVYRWAQRQVGGFLRAADPRLAECRADALVDAALGAMGLLLRWRAGVHASRRPNLGSMLRYRVRARGSDLFRSRHGRHHGARRRRVSAAALDGVGAVTADPARVAFAAEVVALLDGEEPARRALLLVGAGVPIAEAARRTGASRQQVYRCREVLAGEVERRGVAVQRRAR